MAMFYSSNPSEFKLQVSGISGTSDRTFAEESMGAPPGSEDDMPLEGMTR
jgi:hypothetical protein